MKRNIRMKFATMLIAFSFVLIFFGIYLHIEETSVFYDPVKDTKVVSGTEKDNITITTIDGKEPENADAGDSSSNENSESSGQNNSSQGGNSSSPSQGSNATNGNSGGGNTNSSVISPPAPAVPEAPTIDQTNNNLRVSLQNNYGVTVKYGGEISGYSVGGMGTTALTDPYAVQTALNNLSYALSLYPNGFFKEISDGGYPLSIYLIKRYSSGNVTGVTDSSRANVVISIATDFSFADSFHHENFHYIDHYIYVKGGRYTVWNNYNPPGFVYGNINNSYSYNQTWSEDAFFVNNYAQTDAYEDRASTFEYMMAGSKAGCLNYGKTIWLKANFMAQQMEYYLNSVSPNVIEYWERYL